MYFKPVLYLHSGNLLCHQAALLNTSKIALKQSYMYFKPLLYLDSGNLVPIHAAHVNNI